MKLEEEFPDFGDADDATDQLTPDVESVQLQQQRDGTRDRVAQRLRRQLQAQLQARGLQPAPAADPASTGPAYFVVTDPDGNPVLFDQHVGKPAVK
jgi:uncharacterized protein involved in type VI secretion and phage assembly